MIALNDVEDVIEMILYLQGVFGDEIFDQPLNTKSGPAEAPLALKRRPAFMKSL